MAVLWLCCLAVSNEKWQRWRGEGKSEAWGWQLPDSGTNHPLRWDLWTSDKRHGLLHVECRTAFQLLRLEQQANCPRYPASESYGWKLGRNQSLKTPFTKTQSSPSLGCDIFKFRGQSLWSASNSYSGIQLLQMLFLLAQLQLPS